LYVHSFPTRRSSDLSSVSLAVSYFLRSSFRICLPVLGAYMRPTSAPAPNPIRRKVRAVPIFPPSSEDSYLPDCIYVPLFQFTVLSKFTLPFYQSSYRVLACLPLIWNEGAGT